MNTPGQPPPLPRERALLAAGTATYRHGAAFTGGLSDLHAIPKALETIVVALTRLGYSPAADKPFLLNPEANTLKKAISTAAREAPMVVVYYTGHGLKPESRPFYLLTADSDENWLEITALKAEEVLTLVHRPEPGLSSAEQPQVLVILDCCYSGAGGIETLKSSLEDLGNPNVWVLVSAGSREWAQQGLFAQVFTAVLHEAVGVGAVQKFIDPVTLMVEINRALEAIHADQRTSLFPPRGRLEGAPPQFFHNPKYVPDVAGLTIEDQVWIGRLRAAPGQTTTTVGFYVTGSTGRVRAVKDIAGWMHSPDDWGLAVVTGSPGSGKSTLLALPALLADADRADVLLAGTTADSLLARAAGLYAGLPVAGIYARGLNPYEIAHAVAGYLGRDLRSPDDLLEDLKENAPTTPRILVIDAVDEALDPAKLLIDLILPLSRNPAMKVLIGTRPHLQRHLDTASLLIDLDNEGYRDPQGLTDYARQLLLATHEPDVPTPYRDASEELTTAVAQVIAARATASLTAAGQAESFLLAQLLARAVRSRGQVLDVTRLGWAEELPSDVGAAFDEDLARMGKRETAVRYLLTALAWAKGPGLPWENIWVPVAQALADDDRLGARTLDNDDVRWLLENAGGYVVEDIGPGQRSAFRPFHDLLAIHLRNQPDHGAARREPGAADAAYESSQQVEAAITGALLRTIPTGADDHPDWELAHPYLRTYLAQHAHAAGPDTFTRLVADTDFLAVADPTILTPLLTPTDSTLRSTARVYRWARPLLDDNVNDNAAYLYEAFMAETGQPPAGQRIRPAYQTLMARTSPDDSVLTLTGHTRWVTSAAFVMDAEGQLILASAGSDGTVRLWDPDTGTLVGAPLTGHTGWVESVAFGTGNDGSVLLASSGRDGTVRLWDTSTGTPIGSPLTGHSGHVTSVAFGAGPDERVLLASAGTDGTVRLWDPSTGTPIGGPLTGHPGRLRSLAFGAGPDGRLLLASSSSNGTVQMWDTSTSRPEGKPLPGHAGGAETVAFGAGTGGHLLLASAGSDGAVRVWNPVTGNLVGIPFTGHAGRVNSVVFGTSQDGRLLLASAGDDGTVRVWDPNDGSPVGAPLMGHPGRVTSVTAGRSPDGRLILASTGSDGTVRLWEPSAGTRARALITGHRGRVRSVALDAKRDGSGLLASAGDDGTVRLWDPQTAAPVGDPITGHSGRVRSVAYGTTPQGRLLLASAGSDGAVRVWNPLTGDPIGIPLTGHAGRVNSVVFGTSENGRLLLASAGDDGTVRVWDPYDGTPLTGHPGRATTATQGTTVGERLTGRVASVAFGTTPHGRLLLASAGEDGRIRLWDPVTGTPMGGPLTGHTGWVESVAFGTTSDGRLLLASAGDDGMIRLWDPVTGTPMGRPLSGHTGWVRSVAFGTTPDGHLLIASAGEDGTARLWDPLTKTQLSVIHRRTPTTAVALQGSILALAGYEGAAVLEVSSRRP